MRLALIGGTGVDEMPGLAGGRRLRLSSRFGEADVVQGKIGSQDVIFVPRHGLQHNDPPGQVNYRAQIAALKKAGVECVIGICAVGSLTQDLPPGSFALLGDFLDFTRRRADTFFDQRGAAVVHTDFSQPYCPCVTSALEAACASRNVNCRTGVVYVGVEGPRYESPAEIRMYASLGGQVIGMTNTPEVILAREAGLCYGAMAVVSNAAAGLSSGPLAHDDVRQTVLLRASLLQDVVTTALDTLSSSRSECSCRLNSALVV